MSPTTGRVIAGRYRLAEPIGRGAMGVVWRAKDQLLDRDVAIKEVRFNEALGNVERANAYKRTLREARTAARLSHRGVVTVFDVAEEDGRPWIVMELIRSRSLDEVLATDGPMPPGRVARVAQQLLSALAHAHAAGVLHRDVKPSNVLIATSGFDERAVLTDFGIAQFEGDPRLTQTGMVMGSPGFTAPERIRGGDATPASDLWSLGATIYAAAEGRGPYEQRGGAITTMSAIINEDAPVAPSADRLQPVIAALLRRDPTRRPSAAAAASMIAEVLPLLPEGRGGRSGTVLSPSSAAVRRPPPAGAVPPPAPAPAPSAPAPGVTPGKAAGAAPAASGVAATGIDPPAPQAAVARAEQAAKAAAAPAAAAGAAAPAAAKVEAAASGAPGAADASAPDAAESAEGVAAGSAAAAGADSAEAEAEAEAAPDAALAEATPAEAEAAALAPGADSGPAAPAGEPEPEPTALGIPAARVPAPAKPVSGPADSTPGEPGASAAADSPAAGPSDTDQYAKTSLTSSGMILAAAESRSAAASSPAGTASAAAGSAEPGSAEPGSAEPGSAVAGSAAGHEVTVKVSTAAPPSAPAASAAPANPVPASAAAAGPAAPEPTVKVTTAPATPDATVKAATPQAPAARKPAPPQPPDKDAWWSNAYQQQGPSFSPSSSRPAAPYPPAQPGPASPFSQPTQYTPPSRRPGPGTTPAPPYAYSNQYPAGSGGQPPRKGGAGKKILLGILAVIVVAAVVVAATILGKRHNGATPNAVNSSPAASGGTSGSPSGSSGPSAPTADVPPVTNGTPTVVRSINDPSSSVPSGYKPYTLHPSAAGTPAGFAMAVPPGWQVGQQTPQRIFFNAPDGVSNVEVDLTTHTTSDMVAEARSIKQQTQAQGRFPNYKELELGPEQVRQTRAALWRFDWTSPKTGTTLRVDDLLFILPTANGPQSYAIYMTAPEGNATGSWNATILPIVSQMLQSFTPTTS